MEKIYIFGAVAVGCVVAYQLISSQKSNQQTKKKKAYQPNGEVAQRIAAVTPYYPFKG